MPAPALLAMEATSREFERELAQIGSAHAAARQWTATKRHGTTCEHQTTAVNAAETRSAEAVPTSCGLRS